MLESRTKSTRLILPWLVSMFSENDELESGQHWHFTCGISSDENEPDDEVCTMKEIQEVTLYRGIDWFQFERNKLTCEFIDNALRAIKAKSLLIEFQLNDVEYTELVEMTKRIFPDDESLSII
ncbi:MAG: hypothetical protein GFH27_549291n368 [Chloroflexi bacterium AL-W]|nr:hypothetical protein [Chloroflexi bacterium AL-N1]NOK67164.1 hypothetical protein [Chloroflexi bacterium AL-N10]NOK75342.1 hypothetical protein [Chloroflexi bacterium AL-N5]NOK82130.1 hypothetical protein [Chloroflexi bacterium AL-W]NOK89975.1 hypothetical protein [Chloroflexi bacterium AL-N15]